MNRSDEETLDPAIERELQALEQALAGRPVDPELAELAELATELRELRETPGEEFAGELDTRAAAGFPGTRRVADWLSGISERAGAAGTRRRLLPALAGATAVFVVGTAVVATTREGGSNEGASRITSGSMPESATQRDPGGSAAAAPSGDEQDLGRSQTTLPVPLPPDPGIAPGARSRKVERSAEIVLGTEPQGVQEVAGDVLRVVGRYRGFVLSSSVRDGAEGEAGADFQLMIPSGRLSPALADLSELAEVRSRNENTVDITAPFVSARERLRDSRAEAAGLLRQLAQADSDAERASVKAQLRIVRGRIAAFRAEVRRLDRRASFSRVSLAVVTGEQSAILPTGEDEWTVGDALHDAGRVLAVAAGVALVSLAALLPLALLVGAAWLARRSYLRHAREATLGG